MLSELVGHLSSVKTIMDYVRRLENSADPSKELNTTDLQCLCTEIRVFLCAVSDACKNKGDSTQTPVAQVQQSTPGQDNVSVMLRTAEFRGDQAADVFLMQELKQGETVESLVARLIRRQRNQYDGVPESDVVELRVIKKAP